MSVKKKVLSNKTKQTNIDTLKTQTPPQVPSITTTKINDEPQSKKSNGSTLKLDTNSPDPTSKSSLATEKKLTTEWILRSHEIDNKNWKNSDYDLISTIRNIHDFWNVYNHYNLIGGIEARHYFLMRSHIFPNFEDKFNRNGKIWSIKVPLNDVDKVWKFISIGILGESLFSKPQCINGLSINKKDICYILKIWVDKQNYDITDELNKYCNSKFAYAYSIRNEKIKPQF